MGEVLKVCLLGNDWCVKDKAGASSGAASTMPRASCAASSPHWNSGFQQITIGTGPSHESVLIRWGCSLWRLAGAPVVQIGVAELEGAAAGRIVFQRRTVGPPDLPVIAKLPALMQRLPHELREPVRLVEAKAGVVAIERRRERCDIDDVACFAGAVKMLSVILGCSGYEKAATGGD